MAEGPLVFGITWGTHDSSAALFQGDRLSGFVEEERLSGQKHTGKFPSLAIARLLREAGASVEDVSSVSFAFHARGYATGLACATAQACRSPFQRRGWARAASYGAVHRHTHRRLRHLRERFPRAKVVDTPHHLCHSLYAQAASGEERVTTLVVDSIGEWRTTSIIATEGLRQQPHLWLADPHSLGYAYGAVTEHLGYRRGDGEGTVMALAALGDRERFRPVMEQGIALTPDGFRLNPGLFAKRVFSSSWPRLTECFDRETAPAREPGSPLRSVHADIAAALQQRTEEVLLHLTRLAAARTKATTLCLAGGVAMNCLGLGRISESGLFDRVVVPPAPADGGTSIGAGLAVLGDEALRDPQLRRWDLGPEFSEREINEALAARGLAAAKALNPVETVLEELLAGRIVGVCRGRGEAGPRALGHRSILASPLTPGITCRLSSRVKQREGFRPFAPVMPREVVADYFRAPDPSPYMSFALPARDRARKEVPAVVHSNGSARVQSLSREEDPYLYELLQRFAAQTGVPVLINTSLNVKGAAMAGTPTAAIESCEACELDGLLLGGRYLRR